METRTNEGLFAALDQALPDPLGQRWAVAETVGRDWVAVQGADGRVIVDERWQHRGFPYRERRRLDRLPRSLRWRPVARWRAPELTTEQEKNDEQHLQRLEQPELRHDSGSEAALRGEHHLRSEEHAREPA